MEKFKTWEDMYDALLTRDYKDILDTEFETERYYELPDMIAYFKEKGEEDKANFLVELENKIDAEEGRKFTIGDKFLLDDKQVTCIVEIIDFDENGAAYIEYSNIAYKTNKQEIPQDFDIKTLQRIR